MVVKENQSKHLGDSRLSIVPTFGEMEKQGVVGQVHLLFTRLRPHNPGHEIIFTHPLAVSQSGPDALVDFDGFGDPYRPVNWSFRKKVITTVLYGLITMGMYLFILSNCLDNGNWNWSPRQHPFTLYTCYG